MRVQNVINGKTCGSDNIHRGIDPSTQTPLWDVPIATESDLEEAVAVAQKAFISWLATTWQLRQSLLSKMSEILLQHQAEMTDILLKECGKPVPFASLEVQDSIKMFVDINTEEGPIVPIQSWSSEDEVISRANNTTSGLGGSVWSGNLDTAYRMVDKIEDGSVWINSFGKPLAQAYFSGHKDSGVSGEQGAKGLLSYCNTKVIHRYKWSVTK